MIAPCDSRRQGPLAHHVEGQRALGDGAHGVVDATATEAPLGEHLGAVLGAEQVVGGHPHVVVLDVVVVAGLGHDLDAWGVARHHEHAVGAHHEEDVGDPAGAGEPLLAVDDPLVAVLDRVGAEQVGVGAALGFGHRVGGEHLLVEQRLEPALLLLLGAVGGEHLHVAGVGRRGTEELRSGRVLAEDLVDEGELELTEVRDRPAPRRGTAPTGPGPSPAAAARRTSSRTFGSGSRTAYGNT